MKRFCILLTAVIIALTALTQNNAQIHIFRNDLKFNTVKERDFKEMTFEDSRGDFHSIRIHHNDGTTTDIALTAIDSILFRPTGLPEFHVTLTDYPEWTELQGEKEDVRAATIYMEGNGMYDDLPLQEIEFRGRGNSTWYMPKKPYRFKMKKKTSVCGLPKAKTFALIANYIDNTLMRNAVALWIADYLGMPFTNHSVPVKVYLNGVDKGQYMLTEKIGIGTGSVDIDETKGILFELDVALDEDFRFIYNFDDGHTLPVMVKDPDINELAADDEVPGITDAGEYFGQWKADFTKMADAITTRKPTESLRDVIDLESAVNFLLVNDICKNGELCHPKSFYMYKESLGNDNLYHFGPVWDFDWAFTYYGAEGRPAEGAMLSGNGSYSGYTFLKFLFKNQEFKELFKQKLNDFYANGYPQLQQYMEKYAWTICPSAVGNGIIWPSISDTWFSRESTYEFRKNYDTLKKWISDRLTFMLEDANFGLYE